MRKIFGVIGWSAFYLTIGVLMIMTILSPEANKARESGIQEDILPNLIKDKFSTIDGYIIEGNDILIDKTNSRFVEFSNACAESYWDEENKTLFIDWAIAGTDESIYPFDVNAEFVIFNGNEGIRRGNDIYSTDSVCYAELSLCGEWIHGIYMNSTIRTIRTSALSSVYCLTNLYLGGVVNIEEGAFTTRYVKRSVKVPGTNAIVDIDNPNVNVSGYSDDDLTITKFWYDNRAGFISKLDIRNISLESLGAFYTKDNLGNEQIVDYQYNEGRCPVFGALKGDADGKLTLVCTPYQKEFLEINRFNCFDADVNVLYIVVDDNGDIISDDTGIYLTE